MNSSTHRITQLDDLPPELHRSLMEFLDIQDMICVSQICNPLRQQYLPFTWLRCAVTTPEACASLDPRYRPISEAMFLEPAKFRSWFSRARVQFITWQASFENWPKDLAAHVSNEDNFPALREVAAYEDPKTLFYMKPPPNGALFSTAGEIDLVLLQLMSVSARVTGATVGVYQDVQHFEGLPSFRNLTQLCLKLNAPKPMELPILNHYKLLATLEHLRDLDLVYNHTLYFFEKRDKRSTGILANRLNNFHITLQVMDTDTLRHEYEDLEEIICQGEPVDLTGVTRFSLKFQMHCYDFSDCQQTLELYKSLISKLNFPKTLGELDLNVAHVPDYLEMVAPKSGAETVGYDPQTITDLKLTYLPDDLCHTDISLDTSYCLLYTNLVRLEIDMCNLTGPSIEVPDFSQPKVAETLWLVERARELAFSKFWDSDQKRLAWPGTTDLEQALGRDPQLQPYRRFLNLLLRPAKTTDFTHRYFSSCDSGDFGAMSKTASFYTVYTQDVLRLVQQLRSLKTLHITGSLMVLGAPDLYDLVYHHPTLEAVAFDDLHTCYAAAEYPRYLPFSTSCVRQYGVSRGLAQLAVGQVDVPAVRREAAVGARAAPLALALKDAFCVAQSKVLPLTS